MFTEPQIQAFLEASEKTVLDPTIRRRMDPEWRWTDDLKADAGVYAFFDGDVLVYVGETSSLRRRMRQNLKRGRNHTLLRQLVRAEMLRLCGAAPAKTLRVFPPEAEAAARSILCGQMTVAVQSVRLGRKELEEHLVGKYRPRYNSVGTSGS